MGKEGGREREGGSGKKESRRRGGGRGKEREREIEMMNEQLFELIAL